MNLRIIPLNSVKWNKGIAFKDGKKCTGVLQEFLNDRIVNMTCVKGAIEESVINMRDALVTKTYYKNDAGDKLVKIVKNGKENVINITKKQQEGLDISLGCFTYRSHKQEPIVDKLVAKGYKLDKGVKEVNSFWYDCAAKYYDSIHRPDKAFDAEMKSMELFMQDFRERAGKCAKMCGETTSDVFDTLNSSWGIPIKHRAEEMKNYLCGIRATDAKKAKKCAQKLYDFLAKIETNDEVWNKNLLPHFKRVLIDNN